MRRSAIAFGAATLVLLLVQQSAQAQQLLCEQYPGCATYPGTGSISSGTTDPMGSDPTTGTPQTNNQATPNFSSFNEQFASTGSDSFVNTPAMIGDLLAPRIRLFNVPTVSPSGTSRFKLADNQSPIPRNRIFYNFSHFHQAVNDVNSGTAFDVNRHVFGLERTFFDGMTSFEVRIPFADTLAANQNITGTAPLATAVEFGDIGLAAKVLLMNRGIFQMSAGIAGSLPSAPDVVVVQNGNMPATLETNAVHAGPFIGFVLRPGSRLVIQSVIQVDFDLNGNDFVDPNTNTTGTFQDHNLFLATVSAAYWVRQNNNNAFISDIAAICELHYSTSTGDGDFVPLGGTGYDRYSAPIATEAVNVNILNLTGGCEFRFGSQNSVVIGAGVPLRTDVAGDQMFTTEILMHYNRSY